MTMTAKKQDLLTQEKFENLISKLPLSKDMVSDVLESLLQVPQYREWYFENFFCEPYVRTNQACFDIMFFWDVEEVKVLLKQLLEQKDSEQVRDFWKPLFGSLLYLSLKDYINQMYVDLCIKWEMKAGKFPKKSI